MAETIGIDIIGTDGFENVSGVTLINDNLFVSGYNNFDRDPNHIYSLAKYKLNSCGKIDNGPDYDNFFIKDNIMSISNYNNLLLIIPKDSTQIFLYDPVNLEKYELKIFNLNTNTTDNLLDYILNPIIIKYNTLNKTDIDLIQTIIIGNKIYLFLESNVENKSNKLFIIEGSILVNPNNVNPPVKTKKNKCGCKDVNININTQQIPNIFVNSDFKLKGSYCLYKTGKAAGFDKDIAKTTKFKSVTFNKKNMFVLLFSCGCEGTYGFITKLFLYTELNSISDRLQIIKKISDNNSLFLPSKHLSAITYLDSDKYIMITNKCGNHMNKYVIIKIIDCNC